MKISTYKYNIVRELEVNISIKLESEKEVTDFISTTPSALRKLDEAAIHYGARIEYPTAYLILREIYNEVQKQLGITTPKI